MKITKQWGIERSVCFLGLNWFEINKELDDIGIIKKLMSENKFRWANWVLVKIMDYNEYSQYVIYAAEQIIDYDKEYSKEMLDLVKDYLNLPSLDKKKSIEDKLGNFISKSPIQETISFAIKAIIYGDCNCACTSVLYASIAYAKYNYKHDIPINNTANIGHNDIYIDTPYNSLKKKMDLRILNYGLGLLEKYKK
jgi:hypothetical protein